MEKLVMGFDELSEIVGRKFLIDRYLASNPFKKFKNYDMEKFIRERIAYAVEEGACSVDEVLKLDTQLSGICVYGGVVTPNRFLQPSKIRSLIGVVKREAVKHYKLLYPDRYTSFVDNKIKNIDNDPVINEIESSEIAKLVEKSIRLKSELNCTIDELSNRFGINVGPSGRGKRVHFNWPDEIATKVA